MAMFALWVVTGFMCFMVQAQSVEFSERFQNDWASLIAFIVCGVLAPFAILGFAVYASMELL